MSSNIIAALRVKNESRWIADVLESIKWCRRIYVFDDHSSDDTPQIANRCGAWVYLSPFMDFDEARDKEFLTKKIAEEWDFNTWILMIDGDEILAPGGKSEILNTIDDNMGMNAFSLRILYLWNSPDQIRIDGVYGKFHRPSLFRLGREYIFRRTLPDGNLHCSNVPARYLSNYGYCPAKIFHLGYMHREDRINKWKYYNEIDPRNINEGYDARCPGRGAYPHIVQGDIPEVPEDAVLKHAGPLKLQPLGENKQ